MCVLFEYSHVHGVYVWCVGLDHYLAPVLVAARLARPNALGLERQADLADQHAPIGLHRRRQVLPQARQRDVLLERVRLRLQRAELAECDDNVNVNWCERAHESLPVPVARAARRHQAQHLVRVPQRLLQHAGPAALHWRLDRRLGLRLLLFPMHHVSTHTSTITQISHAPAPAALWPFVDRSSGPVAYLVLPFEDAHPS